MFFGLRSKKDKEFDASVEKTLRESDEMIEKAEKQLAKRDTRSLTEQLRNFAK
jgi:hypothetical protein